MYGLINTYRFLHIEDPQRFGRHCYQIARSLGLTGTIIVAAEGFNLALSGKQRAIVRFFSDLDILHLFLPSCESQHNGKNKIQSKSKKKSADQSLDSLWEQCCQNPHFHFFTNLPQRSIKRLRLRVKREIIRADFDQASSIALPEIQDNDVTHLHPQKFHEKLLNEKDKIVVIDMRNDYEIAIGSFENAIDLNLKKFSDLPRSLAKLNLPRDKEYLTYCTGGIRCEKSQVFFKSLNFSQVYQLDGGIFNYLQYYPNGFWQGDCFVFDDRVSLNHDLESGNYERCDVCGQALSIENKRCSYHRVAR